MHAFQSIDNSREETIDTMNVEPEEVTKSRIAVVYKHILTPLSWSA